MEQQDKKYITTRFIIRCVCFALFFIMGLVIGLFFARPFLTNIFSDKVLFEVNNNLGNNDKQQLLAMIASHKVYTASFITERLINFYETLINVLLGIAISGGVLGYLYIKSSHKRDIEEGIIDILKSKTGQNLVKEYTREQTQELFNEEKNSGVIEDIITNATQHGLDIEELQRLQDILSDRIDILENNACNDSDVLTIENNE